MIAKKPAPVVERFPDGGRVAAKPAPQPPVAAPVVPPPAEQRSDTYVVKRGDTLSQIAAAHGLDYRDIARWNNIANPNNIEVGDVLRMRDPQAGPTSAATLAQAPGGQDVTVAPYQSAPAAREREVGADSAKPAGKPQEEVVLDQDVLTTPRAVKLPYSEAAFAKLRAAPTEARAPAPPAAEQRAEAALPAGEVDAVAWSWPAKGAVVANFNENGAPKGIQIAGTMGQPVLASAGGRVVYTGSGLRGYGNLVIIKHNDTFLSAYAHNRAVLVKQGDAVTRGQKIAEMGDSDANRVMLHFEIRRLGKPVDPIRFLPPSG
jgi:lipoprotein NlpD